MKNIITIEEFLKLKQEKDYVLLDCRFNLMDKTYGVKAYEHAHIPGAIYVDLEKHMTGEAKEHGGRHPLPDMKEFRDNMKSLGIDDEVQVYIYDDGDLAAASRLWWMLKYIGKEKVAIIEEGITGWVNRALETTDKESLKRSTEKELSFKINSNMICDMEYVKDSIGKSCIVDSREYERYLGKVEPIDKKAGHIPSAVNYFWKEGFEGLKVKSTEELKERFKELSDKEEIIVHCGSGITGCANVLLMEEAELNPILYLGSWSDWISYENNSVATGDEK